MHVVFVFPRLKMMSGAEHLLLDWAHALVRYGDRCTIVTRKIADTCKERIPEGVVVRTPRRSVALTGVQLVDSGLDLLCAFNFPALIPNDADRVVFWTAETLPTMVLMLRKRRRDVKYIYYCLQQPHFAYDRVWQTAVYNLPLGILVPFAGFLYRFFDIFAAQKADVVLVISRQQLISYRQEYRKVPMLLCSPGIIIPRARPQRMSTACSGTVLLTVGKLIAKKNVSVFVRLIAQLRENGYDVSGVVVGTGPLWTSIVKLRDALNLKEHCLLAGYVETDSELESYYHQADIYVYLEENVPFGLTVLEAAVRGTPVIAAMGGGTDETVIDGETGSDRRFVRVENDNGAKYVLVLWSSADLDWDRFLRIEHDLRRSCPFLPQVFAHDDRHGLILEEDLGALTLCSAVRGLSHPDEIEAVYTQVVEALVSWQGVDPRVSSVIDQRSMDEETFLWESDYFARYCVTDYFGREALLDSVWERQRRALARATAAMPQVVIHRDFQSENILLCGDSVRFVDFQGARRGPAGYDLGSLLFDPYVPALEPALVERLLALYARLCAHPFEREAFFLCSAQRLMQALGAYGNLALHKGKDWYRAYVPVALQRLGFVLEECPGCSRIGDIVKACSDSL